MPKLKPKIQLVTTGKEPVRNPKPFLRWAGGKNWLLKYFEKPLKDFKFNNYHEPFLGGASVFLFIKPKNRSYLSDINPELIKAYRAVKGDVENLISELKKCKNTKTYYYDIRDSELKSKVRKAAKFIFLNQTSFNGIYRVNLDGVYNVPYGYRDKDFLDAENLRAVSKRLNRTKFSTCSFNKTLKNIKKGDLVFLDPPYTVSHNNNGFIKYNRKLFKLEDQTNLAKFIKSIKSKGAYFILTNAAHEKIDEIFGGLGRKVKLTRASLIGGTDAHRGDVSEYLFTNVPTFYK